MQYRSKVFDWEKAARLIKQTNGKSAYARSLSSTDSGTEIFRNGAPVPRQRPVEPLDTEHMIKIGLDIDDRESIVCERDQADTPGWNGDTYWPMSALAILNFPVFVANWPMPAHMFVFQGCGNREAQVEQLPRNLKSRTTEAGAQRCVLAGFPQLTLERDDYLFWRGTKIERYKDCVGESPEFQAWAQTIGDRCLSLEARGFEVNWRTVNRFDLEFNEAPAESPWREALCRYSQIFSRGDRLRLTFYKRPLRHGIVALEKRGQNVYGEEYDDTSDAIDGILAQGFKLETVENSYRALSEVFARSNLTRNEIRAVLLDVEIC